MKKSFIALAAMALMSTTVMAQDAYPSKPINFLVPYAAGANADIVSRLIANELQAELGQPVVVENMAGAGGNVGAAAMARKTTDSHDIMFATNTHTISQNLYDDAGYDLATDFTPVSLLTKSNMLLIVNGSSEIDSAQALVEKAGANRLTYGSGGNGLTGHLLMELFNLKTGTKITHVPYAGVAASLTDLVANRVDATFATMTSVAELVKDGQLKVIGVAAADRVPNLPDVPTLAEAGIEGIDLGNWQGIVASVNITEDEVATLNAALAKILTKPEISEQLTKLGLQPSPSTAAEFGELIKAELVTWGDVITSANITLD